MRLKSLLVISVLSSLTHISHAFPLKPQAPPNQPTVRRRVAYSVVAVDGGSAAIASAAPVLATLTLIQTSNSIETVTAPASSTPPSIQTIVATTIFSKSEPLKTVDVILTQDITKTASLTTMLSYIVVSPAETSTSSSIVPPTTQTDLSTVSVLLPSPNPVSEVAPQTELKCTKTKVVEAATSISSSSLYPPPAPTIRSTRTLPTASMRTYNDGMWHTTYPVWNATSTVLSSASATTIGTSRAKNLWKKG